jgi:hypothetical protein
MFTGKGLKYDWANNIWKGDIATYKTDSQMFFALNAYLYYCGDSTSSNLTAHKYDTDSQVWSAITDLPWSGEQRASTCDGIYGYATNGQTGGSYSSRVDRYDPSSNTWLQRADTGSPCRANAGYALNGKAYVFGGYNCGGGCCATTYHGEYDNAGNTWTGKSSYPAAMNQQIGIAPPANKAPNAPTGLSVGTS